jgi:hypothetical protein
MAMRTLTKDFEYLDNEQLYVIKNVPYKIYNNDEEAPIYSVKISVKVATLIDLMRTQEINETELNYQEFANINFSL